MGCSARDLALATETQAQSALKTETLRMTSLHHLLREIQDGHSLVNHCTTGGLNGGAKMKLYTNR